MLLYLTALSLPKRGTYIALHRHRSEQRMRWTETDRANYLDFLSRVEQLYRDGPAGLQMPRPLLEAVYDSSLTAQQATNRILPYYLACPKGSVDRSFLLAPPKGDLEVLGLAGTTEEPHGLRFVVIAKGADRLKLKPSYLEKADLLDSIEGRSSLDLVRLVAEADEEPAESGTAKIVAVPAEVNVQLSRNARGEFVKEVSRVWS